MESLPTLFGRTVVHVLGDADPIVGALFAHQLGEKLVLIRYPRSSTVSVGHCVVVLLYCGVCGGESFEMGETEVGRQESEDIMFESEEEERKFK